MRLHSLARLHRALPYACILTSVLLLSNCAKKDSGTFTGVYNNTLKKGCIECHVSTGAVYQQDGIKLDFSTQQTAYDSLLSAVDTSPSNSSCNGVKIVQASSAATSYLAAVLFSDYAHSDFVKSGCTPYNEHHSSQNISSDEKTSIIDWINNGAKND